MAEIVEFLADEQLQIGIVAGRDKKRVTVNDQRGRPIKLAPEKLLFQHVGGSIDEVLEQLQRLQQEIDVELLWAALNEESSGRSRQATALARLFFEQDDPLHASAIFRALSEERLHFRRRGTSFEARTAEEIMRLRQQREAETHAAEQHQALVEAFRRRAIDDALAERLERFLRGQADKQLSASLAAIAREPAGKAFDLLRVAGRLSPTADLAVIQIDLDRPHPAAAVAHAEQLELSPPAEIGLSALAIDDPETREVDDAVTLERDGERFVLHIDIADAARFVEADDPVDREARRRASSLYLPTGAHYMLPEAVGTRLATLTVGEPRPVVRTSVWLEPDGTLVDFRLSRLWTRLERRLDYEQADAQIAAPSGALGETLAQLSRLTTALRERRLKNGGLTVRRPEWKLRVDHNGVVLDVKRIRADSPARELVAETMILTNHLAARLAIEARVPVIFRVQPAPSEPLPQIDPDDPAGFARLKGLISPAKLSLHPAPHFGLGLSCYTQVTSPLRRYSDLVQQRQLVAHLEARPPTYGADDLLKVLAAVEGTDQELKRVEWAVSQRWAMEWVVANQIDGMAARIVGETATANLALLLDCGAQGLLQSGKRRQLAIGDEVLVDVDEVNPRRGQLHLRLHAQ